MNISTKFTKSAQPLAVVRNSRRYGNKQFYIVDGSGEGVNITIHDGLLSVLPQSTRNVQYIFGPSGSGKSTWIGNFLAEWVLANPGQPVFVVSRKNSDIAFDGIPLKYIDTATLVDEPMNSDDFPENSMVVFDDVDTIQPNNVKMAVHSMMNDILEVGRARNINCIVSSHLGSDYKRTRTILNEAHGLTFFPHGSSAKDIKYILETYGGMSKVQINTAKQLPSRWIHLKRSYPPAIVYGSGCYLLHSQKNEPTR